MRRCCWNLFAAVFMYILKDLRIAIMRELQNFVLFLSPAFFYTCRFFLKYSHTFFAFLHFLKFLAVLSPWILVWYQVQNLIAGEPVRTQHNCTTF